MYQNLIVDAKKAGMEMICVIAIIRNEYGEILLVKERTSLQDAYRFPTAQLKPEESISQAIQRALVEETSIELKEVIGYLGHWDSKKKRDYYFVASGNNPYAIEGQTTFIYSWVDPREGIGYPIIDEVREAIDLYMRFSENR